MNARHVSIMGVAAAALMLAAAPGSDAKIGTGVGAAPITLKAPARAGSNYSLPSLWVVNTGDEPAIYAVAVTPSTRTKQNTTNVRPAWVKIARRGFRLAPGEGTWVPLALSVPRDAPGGRYEANLVAGTVRENAGGAGLGAAAATRLQFRVIGGRPEAQSRGDGPSPAALAGAAIAAAAVALAEMHRRRRRRSL